MTPTPSMLAVFDIMLPLSLLCKETCLLMNWASTRTDTSLSPTKWTPPSPSWLAIKERNNTRKSNMYIVVILM